MSFVEFKNVYYSYNHGAPTEIRAIKDLSFDVEKGEFIALVGNNGSGKSTIAKLINGLLLPQKGTVTVDGIGTEDKNKLFDIRKQVGVVFQNPDNQTVATIIEDDVAFGPENIGLESKEIRSRVDWALKAVGMYDYREKSSFRLSGGQKQRVAIAGVLAIKPRLMVLDEATAMLDPRGKKEVMDVIVRLNKEEHMTIIMITHFMDEAALADRIMVMNDGELILSGDKSYAMSKRDVLDKMGLGVPPAMELRSRLSRKGIDINETFTEHQLVEELCRLL